MEAATPPLQKSLAWLWSFLFCYDLKLSAILLILFFNRTVKDYCSQIGRMWADAHMLTHSSAKIFLHLSALKTK